MSTPPHDEHAAACAPTDFFIASNLLAPAMIPGLPWKYAPDAEFHAMLRKLEKKQRKSILADLATKWQVYSSFRGVLPSQRISKDNPVSAVLGFVADYDVKTPLETVQQWLNQMPPAFQPQFIETSLGDKVRLVWTFPEAMPVRDTAHAAALVAVAFEKIKVPSLLPGYDPASEKVSQVWTNGGIWNVWLKEPMDLTLLVGFSVEAAKKIPAAHAEVNIDVIADEVRKRWPGRWQGEFKLDALGVRFWDPAADNTAGCQVKPDGMLCFTGHTGFKSWSELLGNTWMSQQRTMNLGKAARDIYFDGGTYYVNDAGRWGTKSREDTLLHLRTSGVESIRAKGQTASDADQVLAYIQTTNRIAGALPLFHRPPNSLIDLGGNRILNISNNKPLEPAAGKCYPHMFPLIHDWHQGFLVPRPGWYPLETLLAWLQRGYISFLTYEAAMSQAIFIFGPANSGKTLWAQRIACPLFGGNMVNPYRYFIGQTSFTDNLFSNPLWAINDEESPDEREKHKMQSRVKSAVVNPTHTYHPKFLKEQTTEWQGRFIDTGNLDAQSVGHIPEINEGTADKISLYQARERKNWPEKKALEAQIAAERPYFARWLLDWKAPAEILTNTRMGIKSYFDPEILRLSQQQTFGYDLAELIATWIPKAPDFPPTQKTWTGTPTDLLTTMSIHPELMIHLKTLDSRKIARSLHGMARLPGSGIKFIGNRGRNFEIDREQMLGVLP